MVRSHKDGASTYMGSLRFEGSKFTFWERNAAFVEIYATSKIPRSGIPKVKVTFGYPRVNSAEPGLKSVYAYYYPQRSPQCAKTNGFARAIVVEVGAMFVRKGGLTRQPLKLEATK